MRRLFMVMVAGFVLATFSTCGQEYYRNGKEFVAKQRKKSATKNDINTGYTWKDSKGRVYEIWMSSRGACYILVQSQKTGKVYKSYLPREISTEIEKEIKQK